MKEKPMRYVRAIFFILSILAFITSCSAGKRPTASSQASVTGEHSTSVKPVIILDAGHGGTDEGAKVRSLKEKKITLLATLLTKKHLEQLGYKVILTRSKDVYLSLPRRVSIANKAKAMLFVSVHFNASVSTEAHGIEVFYYDSNELLRSRSSKRLASCILYRVIDQTEAISRGVKQGNFHVIRETEMPAVLVEGGFITNQTERDRLKDREYLDRLAVGIAQGVDRYLRT